MNSLRRNKRTLFLCKRDNNAEYETYLEPIEKRYNYKIISMEKTIENTGEISIQYMTIKDINSKLNDVDLGDRFYMIKPEPFDDRCTNADYQVVAKAVGLDFTEIQCEKLSGRNYGNRR